MNKKNLLRLIGMLVCIILILIIIILLVNLNNKKKNDSVSYKPYNRADFFDDNIEYVSEDVIIPNNSYLFFAVYVDGKVDSKEIYESIDRFAKQIVLKLYTDLKEASDEEISEYYTQNKESLKKYLEINYKEDFIDFMKIIKSLKSKELNVTDIEFVENTMSYKNEYTISKLKITYNQNEFINFNVKVFKKIQNDNRNVVFY